ncbi:MAG: methylmalonyl Co-A mutase-associated GTPase MeaB [Bacteroidota bacterium]|nr:methylmalonyl Co-A mutase-associated GTPase MeaB [Bacteroidota bacterium]
MDQFSFLMKNINALSGGNFLTLARTISLIENEVEGYENFMAQLPFSSTPIIGITGAPGSGKSSLADALIGEIIKEKKKVGVICVDPSSPFNKGALLGDRIRMGEWYNHPDVFIRSLASKGSLGGLHPKIIEITDVMKAAGFDYIIIETVGVGQSEVDIAALADITIVVLVPEGGDIIQTMKAGVMEVADIFVINKFDRPDAESYYNNLMQMLAPAFHNSAKEIPVIKTIASQKKGIEELYNKIVTDEINPPSDKKANLIFEKAWSIIQSKRMRNINKEELKRNLLEAISKPEFNLYRFAEKNP